MEVWDGEGGKHGLFSLKTLCEWGKVADQQGDPGCNGMPSITMAWVLGTTLCPARAHGPLNVICAASLFSNTATSFY